MAELITAYETLMDKHSAHFLTDLRDSKVALACEMYTISELRNMRNVFDVYSFRVNFSDDATTHDKTKGEEILERSSTTDKIYKGDQHLHLDPTAIAPLKAHPGDSISDLKRHIQSCFSVAWGLDGRRVDRDGLYLGWELVYCCNGHGKKDSEDGVVLSYHLFIHSYGIQEG
eukprot:CAMPEP_0181079384 /NCGR_PEP_ID=MMETSP1071-20121207/2001_1 /TAXON_ID=35127 /ORGANISM="Thalassiosira sp., Strain NH16" /LENGTH=171 /DNA_ID=CAMNT_0023160783 /DNA_START=555 /DNA_END=1066 /DNA_ORIENTATION=-